MDDTPTAETLDVPGGKLADEVQGRGSPVVLIHEGIADRRMWNREFPLLAGHHSVTRYDLRGFRGSPPATSESFPVRDLVALIDHLHMERPLIVGPSMGGKTALDLTLAHPKKVGGLLLIAPGYSGMDYDHVQGGKATFERDETLSKAAADRLNEIRVPTHILVGDRDNPAMPHCANFLARGIAGASVKLVPGADHLPNLSRPDAFDAAFAETMSPIRGRSE